MMIRHQEALLTALRSLFAAERKCTQAGSTQDQLAAYVMEMAERVKELREVVDEMELSR